MPEGPEVRKIVEQMRPFVLNKNLKEIKIHSGRYTKNSPDGLTWFQENLPLKLTHLDCKGKFIYFKFGDYSNIWNTLGLTGGWTNNLPEEHRRITFNFDDADPIYFSDIRNFGTLKFVKSEDLLQKKLASLGTDILMEDMSDQLFRTKIKNRAHKTLPEILMDQSVIAGIGNYIKAEALYISKLSPHRKAGSLTDDQISLLNKAIHSVIRDSYNSGGSTFRTYMDFNGAVGNFTDKLMVYGKQQDPLGNMVVSQETKDKRTTWWVPRVQS
jgi:formamidopyrimidine-DNA glycosylase